VKSEAPSGEDRRHVTVTEAATQLGISSEAVRLALKRGALEGFEMSAGSRVRRYVYVESLSAYIPRVRRRKAAVGDRTTSGFDPVRLAAENANLRETNLMLIAAADEDKRVRQHYVKAAEHMARALSELAACDASAGRTREYLENAIAQWNLPESAASVKPS